MGDFQRGGMYRAVKAGGYCGHQSSVLSFYLGEFVQLMMDTTNFVVLGNLNAITYNDIFKHIKDNKIRLGYVNGYKMVWGLKKGKR